MTRGTTLISNSIAVLDERSITDSTFIIHQCHSKDFWEDDPIVGPAEVTDDGDIWWKWRVPFKKSWAFWLAVSNMSIALDTIPAVSEPDYHSSEGMVDTETALKDHGY